MPPFLLPHSIIQPPGHPPSQSHHIDSALYCHHHGFLFSPECCPSPISLPRILLFLNHCLLPAGLPSRHTCCILIASAPLCLTKSLLPWPSIGYPPPSTATMGPVSTPRLCNLSPPARRIQIWAGGPPTVPPSLDVYRFFPYGPCTRRLQYALFAFPFSRLYTVASVPIFPSPAVKNPCGPLLSSFL